MSQRRAHNKIPQDQDDHLMDMARREVRAAEAVSAFLDAFPDFTAPDGDRVKRATFLYRHRLVRVRAEGRAEQGETTAQPDQPANAPGTETAAGPVATLNDTDVGAGEAAHVEPPKLFIPTWTGAEEQRDMQLAAQGAGVQVPEPKLVIPSEADAPKLPQVGDRVRVVAGCAVGSCGVVREVVSDGQRPSIAVVFDEDVGLWFSPECLVVVGDEAPAEAPSAGGMDGEVRRAEAERDELRAKLSVRDAEVAEARRVAERLRKRVDRLNDYIDRLESDGFCTSIRVEGKPIGPMPKSIEFGPLQPAPDSARITLAEEVVRVVRAELEKLCAAKEPPIAPNLAQRYTEIMNLTASSLRECASANRSVSDALQALAAQQADAVAAKDAEIATLKLHLDDLRRQAGLS
jgi:hypothetical protein